ncbi:MAG: cytochrome c [Flavipsychrobacter sp.]|jgi:hypothetical protein|nr:cytochrome c [Flavipsychrobacter sp.]
MGDISVTLAMVLKHIGLFLTCCWVLIIGICGLLLFMAFRTTSIEREPFICGNAAYLSDSTVTDGKAVFQNNCASCHNPLKDATGPALADIISFRSKEWVCKFLTEPKFIPNDKRAINLRKQYGLSCMKFPQLSCEEINAVLGYFEYH